jgi:cobalt-precorrin 5A hydrolase
LAVLDARHAMGGDETVKSKISIGIGCCSDASLDDILQLIDQHVGAIRAGTVLATIDRRATIAQAVANALRIPVQLFAADALARVSGVSVTSQIARETAGTPSVAEAAAIAALGGSCRLVLRRQTGRRCTCASAEFE